MYVLTAHIEIGSKIKFDFVTEVRITSSWTSFTDTAEIEIPRNIRIAGDPDGIKKYIKQGDPVLIRLGYDGNFNTEFQGFVSRIKPDVPLVIYCEDYMYHLKRVNITKSFKTVTLKELVSYLVGEYHKDTSRPRIDYDALDTGNIGSFVFEDATILKCLETIKDISGFVSYFRGSKLYVGFPYSFTSTGRGKYIFQKNVAESSLEYRMTEDLRLNVKAISHNPDGKKTTIEVGDPDGETRTLNYYNKSETELRAVATNELAQLKKDGYRGSLTGFGIPFVQHGDTVEILDTMFPERQGKYLVDKTKVTFGIKGFRRIVEPGKAVS